MAYLIHFNKNHSSKDGRFVSGDRDGDGQLNDNANRPKKKGVFSNTGRGRALKKGIIATAAVVGGSIAYEAGSEWVLKKLKEKISNSTKAQEEGAKFLENMAVRAAKAKLVGGDWKK